MDDLKYLKEVISLYWIFVAYACSTEIHGWQYNDYDLPAPHYHYNYDTEDLQQQPLPLLVQRVPDFHAQAVGRVGQELPSPSNQNVLYEMHSFKCKRGNRAEGKKVLRGVRGVIPDYYLYSCLRRARKRELEGERPPCPMDELMKYLASLQIVNPESIVNLASGGSLDTLCKKLYNNIADVDKYLHTCELPQQKGLYMKLINGVQTLNKMLCKDRHFKSEFKKHEVCLSTLGDAYSACIGPNDWLENPDANEVCKTYADISTCYYNKTAEACGSDAGELIRVLIKGIVDSVLTVYCEYTTLKPAGEQGRMSNNDIPPLPPQGQQEPPEAQGETTSENTSLSAQNMSQAMQTNGAINTHTFTHILYTATAMTCSWIFTDRIR